MTMHLPCIVIRPMTATEVSGTTPREAEPRLVRVGIIGATGYVGGELVRLLARHPNVELVGLVGRDRDHDPIGGIHPHLATTDLDVHAPAPAARRCLPGAAARRRRRDRRGDGRDRARRSSTSGRTSGCATRPTTRAGTASSTRARTSSTSPSTGSPSFIAPSSRRWSDAPVAIVGSPGCYPTATLLALAPLARAGPHRRPGGRCQERRLGRGPRAAGRASCSARSTRASRPTASVAIGTSPRSSRSSPGSPVGEGLDPSANPGIVGRRLPPPPHPDDPRHPVGLPRAPDPADHPGRARRAVCGGLRRRAVRHGRRDAAGHHATSTGSNQVRIHVSLDERTGRILAIGVEDNLVKGAAGQAIQSFNLVHGLPETAGLEQLPLAP